MKTGNSSHIFDHPDGHTVDLTALTTQPVLLDRPTRDALWASGGPFEVFDGYKWVPSACVVVGNGMTYRVKPLPRPPKAERVLLTYDHQEVAYEISFVSDGRITEDDLPQIEIYFVDGKAVDVRMVAK